MTGAGVLIVFVRAATGVCFAVVAGLSISAIAVPVRHFHVSSVVVAAMAICLAYLAFRAAIVGRTDEETLVASLLHGMMGALIGTIVGFALLLMFRPGIQSFLAHALSRRGSSFTTFRFLVASVLLGFGTGFVVRTPKNPPHI